MHPSSTFIYGHSARSHSPGALRAKELFGLGFLGGDWFCFVGCFFFFFFCKLPFFVREDKNNLYFILREKKEDNANKLRTLKGARNSRCPWRLGKQLWFRRFF